MMILKKYCKASVTKYALNREVNLDKKSSVWWLRQSYFFIPHKLLNAQKARVLISPSDAKGEINSLKYSIFIVNIKRDRNNFLNILRSVEVRQTIVVKLK